MVGLGDGKGPCLKAYHSRGGFLVAEICEADEIFHFGAVAQVASDKQGRSDAPLRVVGMTLLSEYEAAMRAWRSAKAQSASMKRGDVSVWTPAKKQAG